MSPATLVAAERSSDTLCAECSQALNPNGDCLTVECSRSIASATRTAGRSTAKVNLGAAAGELRERQPRAFTSRGNVD